MADNPYDQFDALGGGDPQDTGESLPSGARILSQDGARFTLRPDGTRRLLVDVVGGESGPKQASTSTSSNPYDQFDDVEDGSPARTDANSQPDRATFHAEVRRRFDEGASAGDLEAFAKGSGYDTSDLSHAIALRDDPNAKQSAASAFWGALGNFVGPQVSHLIGAASGLAETPFGTDTSRQNISRDQIGMDAERDAFAGSHPLLAGGLGIGGSIQMLPAKGSQALLGAAQGASQSESYNPLEIAVDAGKGAVGAVVGSKVFGGVAGAIAPKLSPYIQTLIDAGVKPTVGQIARVGGGVMNRIVANLEDRATALPIVGDAISAARDVTDMQFRQGAVRQALDKIKVQLPAGLDTGHAMVDYAQKAVSKAYDSALLRMRMVPDQKLASDVQGLAYTAQNGGLSGPLLDRFKADVQNVVARRVGAGGGQLDGRALQTTLSSLRGKAARFSKSSDAEQQEYGDALGQLADHIEEAAARSSPTDAVAARDAANDAYAHLIRVEGAAKNATAGDFTPGQLETAVRQGGRRVRGRDVSAGQAVGQDYATAARKVLPSKTGSSGTTERRNTVNPVAWAAGAALAPGNAIAQHVIAPALTRSSSPTSKALANLIRAGQPAAAAVAAPLLVRVTQ